VTRSISGVASSMADSAAAQDDADEERRRNARASWKRATTKVASALRLAREDQQEGEVAGALHGMEEELELARREEEELIREAEEDNKLVFIERVKAAAFAVSDLMMRDLMAFIVSYPVKCLELMRDMESALPDESMDPPAFGGIMGMLRGQGPLFCVRRMYSGFGCALVAQMGGTLLCTRDSAVRWWHRWAGPCWRRHHFLSVALWASLNAILPWPTPRLPLFTPAWWSQCPSNSSERLLWCGACLQPAPPPLPLPPPSLCCLRRPFERCLCGGRCRGGC